MDKELRHLFEPLDQVDKKTLERIANELRGSNNKKKKAVGVFLNRVNRFLAAGIVSQKNDDQQARSSENNFNKLSGLKDL